MTAHSPMGSSEITDVMKGRASHSPTPTTAPLIKITEATRLQGKTDLEDSNAFHEIEEEAEQQHEEATGHTQNVCLQVN